MATQVTNEFTSWNMSDQEIQMAQTLSAEQVMYFQTMMAGYASKKLALAYNSQNPLQSAQREAELQGQIGVLQQILADHEDAIRRSEEASTDSPQ